MHDFGKILSNDNLAESKYFEISLNDPGHAEERDLGKISLRSISTSNVKASWEEAEKLHQPVRSRVLCVSLLCCVPCYATHCFSLLDTLLALVTNLGNPVGNYRISNCPMF